MPVKRLTVPVGKSSAFFTAMEARIKAQVLAEVTRTYPEVVTQSDTLTVIFYESAIRGSVDGVAGKMILTPNAGEAETKDFAELNAALPAFMQSFFESDEFTDVSVSLKDKSSGDDKVDGNGDVIYQKKVKFYNHPYFHRTGVDTQGNNYEIFSIAKYNTMPSGYKCHHAFIKSDNATYKDYILISKYPLSEVVTGDSFTFNGSFSGAYPISEVQPETRIHPRRSKYEQGMRFEMLYFAMLCAIIYGDRAMGYQDNASMQLANHFVGNALDIDGYKLNSSGNSNSASNTFAVPNDNPYAEMVVGCSVTFLSHEQYRSYGSGSSTYTSETRTITAKEVGGSYTTFTFDGEAYLSYNKYLHANYMGKTGVTDSINYISGYRTDYPKGYQPFKLLGLENPFGMYATWLDWIKSQSNSATRVFSYGNNVESNADSWDSKSHTNVSGWITTWYENPNINAFLPSTNGGDSVTYYGMKYQKLDNTAMVYGRDNATDFKHGSLFSYCSCLSVSWTTLALSSLVYGCWGRVYRSVE